jgi:hypothetical protein
MEDNFMYSLDKIASALRRAPGGGCVDTHRFSESPQKRGSIRVRGLNSIGVTNDPYETSTKRLQTISSMISSQALLKR